MAGGFDELYAKDKRIESANIVHEKRSRKKKGSLTSWKSRALEKKKYEIKKAK